MAQLLSGPEYAGVVTYDILGQTYDRLTVEDVRIKELEVEAAQKSVNLAKSGIVQAQKNIDYTQKQIKDSTIVAPFIGVVATLFLQTRRYHSQSGSGGARVPIKAGLFITGILTWQLYTLDTSTANNTLMLITGLRGIGMGFALTPVTTYALGDIPLELTSQASTINRVLFSVFASMGAAILASLLTSYEKTNLALMVQTATPDSGITLQILSIAQIALQKAGLSFQAA